MKNVKDAIRYGIDTLKVSPEQLFDLIESSNGYMGSDYDRWLANEIIKIAEAEGVGYSQLLVKKFNIIQSIAEEYSDDSLKDQWVSIFRQLLASDGKALYTVGLEGIGSELEDVDWFSGVDLDAENSEFVDTLPEEFKWSFLNNKAALLCRITSEPASKDLDLFAVAKAGGLDCKNEGALMLYRMCMMVSAFDKSSSDFTLGLLVSTDFLSSQDNQTILKYFLDYFRCSGFVIKASNLLKDTYSEGSHAFIVAKPRLINQKMQDGFVLREAVLSEEGYELVDKPLRYSYSSIPMLKSIKGRTSKLRGKGMLTEPIAYLENGEFLGMKVVSEDTGSCIPITKENFESVIVLYGLTKSLESFSIAGSYITDVVTGNREYKELMYNCLPLFIFDTLNTCGSRVWFENSLVMDMLDRGDVYFSFEAKELMDLCKGFLDFLEKEGSLDKGLSFYDVVKSYNNSDLNSQYLSAITCLKDYICTLYRKF